MPIVDAQVHIWANNKPKNPNHRQVTTFSTGRDKELVMGRAVCNWLDWKLP